MVDQLENELQKAIVNLSGEMCWATSPVKSWIMLHLGSKIRRSRPINNPHLDEELRYYVGSIIIDLFCYWEIIKGDSILFTSDDYDDESESLNVLKGKKLINARISENHDLLLVFEKDIHLHAVADKYEGLSYNYGIYLPDVIYGVMPKGKIEVNTRDRY